MFHLLLQLQLCFPDLRLHDLSQRMHVRPVLFGHVLYVREARPWGLSLRHLLLEVLLVLRRLLDRRLHQLSQRMHVRRVLFGHVLYVRDARPLGLSLRHLLLLEVVLVLRRLHLHPLEGRGREMEGETEGEREGETEGEREGETEGEREGETEGEREREGDRWVRVPVTVRVSG
jgi:hypothetical protein